ncbi:hypothetical protein Lal_00029106 [Lupinus albus]|uniref:Putative X8 domain-containing protein n=1 Tax=Lupinus albus TaxID=3870 RepID=A0A6A5NGG8_LUPAL|nr:putative X8 domain-containing protein [Lupinus albus]KAF1885217.1 hypothetical protein Lal_00029106 [Lupinus albus]
METSMIYLRVNAGILLYLILAAISLTLCGADKSMRLLKGHHKHRRNLINKQNPKIIKHFDLNQLDLSNVQPYSVSSPFALPPYESLAPIPLPENNPPFCVYPSPTPTTPTTIPTPTWYQFSPPPSPVFPTQNPPPSPTPIILGPSGSLPTPTPEIVLSPPSQMSGSPEPILNPPIILPGPPRPTMNPPYFEPSPPSPTMFHPPVVYPPPSVLPPPYSVPVMALWCVAKSSVPEPIIQVAMDYACLSGADCSPIQPNGPCFEPNTVFAHASYAFNSLWQRTKAAGGTCAFGGTAILISVDPSEFYQLISD